MDRDGYQALYGMIGVKEVHAGIEPEEVLPDKMKWNLESIRRFSFGRDVLTMFRTVIAVIHK